MSESARAADEQAAAPFDVEGMVWDYRFADARGEKSRVQQLRKEWADWQGEDSLHEMAFGEPITAEALAEHKERLIERLRRIESELAFLETIETA